VTSTDGANNMIVWVVGTEDHGNPGDQRLHGYDGDTGTIVYGGGGPNELMAGTHFYSTTGIAARGRIYVAGDNKVYAFAAPVPMPCTETHSNTETSPKSAPSPDARTLTREDAGRSREFFYSDSFQLCLTEKIRRLGFAPVRVVESTRVCVCSL
jgi:hypothetical protein